MSKQRFILAHQTARKNAVHAVVSAPDGYMVRIEEPKRSLDQNAKFHAICSDLARSGVPWQGRPRTQDEWKLLLVSAHAVATKQQTEIVPGLEGEFVNLRESTAQMSKSRLSSLIEYAVAFCATYGIELSDRPAMEAA